MFGGQGFSSSGMFGGGLAGFGSLGGGTPGLFSDNSFTGTTGGFRGFETMGQMPTASRFATQQTTFPGFQTMGGEMFGQGGTFGAGMQGGFQGMQGGLQAAGLQTGGLQTAGLQAGLQGGGLQTAGLQTAGLQAGLQTGGMQTAGLPGLQGLFQGQNMFSAAGGWENFGGGANAFDPSMSSFFQQMGTTPTFPGFNNPFQSLTGQFGPTVGAGAQLGVGGVFGQSSRNIFTDPTTGQRVQIVPRTVARTVRTSRTEAAPRVAPRNLGPAIARQTTVVNASPGRRLRVVSREQANVLRSSRTRQPLARRPVTQTRRQPQQQQQQQQQTSNIFQNTPFLTSQQLASLVGTQG